MGITRVCPSDSLARTKLCTGRGGARTLGPAQGDLGIRAQHTPAEPIQQRRTQSQAVPPAQADELQMA
eukprot:2177865-Alexandrium_andersonii.AAC.1